MTDFGWSAETVVLILRAAKAIHDAFKNGPRECQELLEDFDAFYQGLVALEALLKQYKCSFNVGCATWNRTIEKCGKFQKRVEQFSAKRFLTATKHAFSNDVDVLRRDIITSTQLLNLQCNFVSLQVAFERDNLQGLRPSHPITRHSISQTTALRIPTIPEIGNVSTIGELPTPIVLDSPSPSSTMMRAHTPSELPSPINHHPVRYWNELQQIRHGLEAYDNDLLRQRIELEGSAPQTTIHELSECNYDNREPVVESPEIVQSPIVSSPRPESATIKQIARTRSEIHDILERVINIQKRADSIPDSGYGTMDSTSSSMLSRKSSRTYDLRRRDSLAVDIGLYPHPLFSPTSEGGLFDDTEPTEELPLREVERSPRWSETSSNFMLSTSPSSAPTIDESMGSPLLSPKGLNSRSRAASIQSNAEPPTDICTGCVLQLTSSRGDSYPYPSKECACEAECDTALKYFRRPGSRGITLIMACTRSGREVQQELSSRTWVVPHIRRPVDGENKYSVSFKDKKMWNCFRNVHREHEKSKPKYVFTNAIDFRRFQELIFDKDLVEIFYLRCIKTSAGEESGSETARIWRDRNDGELSILIHGALFERGCFQHYERSKSGFDKLESKYCSSRKKSVRLHTIEIPQPKKMDRRSSFASDVSSATSRTSGSRVKALTYIDLCFDDDRDDLRKFLEIWEPSLLSSL